MTRTSLRRALSLLAAAVGVGAAVLVGRGLTLPPTPTPPPDSTVAAVDRDWAATRLAGSIRFRTIATAPESSDMEAFRDLHAYLKQSFPQVFSSLHHETVGRHSLLLRWDGQRSDEAPILLTGHLDVVPVEPAAHPDWVHPPFAGVVQDEFVWGRGALDDKVGVISILCAIEGLLGRGFAPARTVYVAFGDDEEIGGRGGAAAMAKRFRDQGVHFELVLDEGGIVLEEGLPGLKVPAALVGVAEKGYASLSLTVRGEGGHSSMPPSQTSIGVMAAALTRIEEQPLDADLRPPTDRMLESLATAMPWTHRVVLANLWLFEPVVRWGLARDPSSNALIRTTTAATVFHAGSADNALPTYANALVNFRILPGDTVEDVIVHVTQVVDDPRVEIEVLPDARDPSIVSSTETAGFEVLAAAIRKVFRGSVVAPYLVVGGTDARHYAELADGVYRFLPVGLAAADRPRIHGTNERIAIDDLVQAVHFYEVFIRDMAGGAVDQ